MARRPSFQFYPADWLSNAKLRGASYADRGLWMDVMCVLHDSDKYGIFFGTLNDLASRVHCHVNQLRSLIHQDILKGAPKGQKTQQIDVRSPEGVPLVVQPELDGPCWFSSRMVIDEFNRERSKVNGKLGGNPLLIKNNIPPPSKGVNPRVNPALKKEREMKSLSGNGEGVGEESAFDRRKRLLKEKSK